MKILVGVVLILALAACSKQEPLPAKNEAGGSSPDSAAASGHKAPPTSNPTSPAEDRKVGAGLPRDEAASTAAPSASTAAPTPAIAAPNGEALFKSTCATCHMPDGSGVPNLQPSIKGSAWISNPDPQLLLTLILRGSAILGEAAKAYDNDMPPVDALNDADLAAVATYVRGRFATPPLTEPVTPAQAAIARARPGLPE